VGLVVSKAVGPAVTRNLVKRRLRHLAREHLDQVPDGSLLVLRALPAAAEASYAELGAELQRCLDGVRARG
jgi:ribonuclease P protein component